MGSKNLGYFYQCKVLSMSEKARYEGYNLVVSEIPLLKDFKYENEKGSRVTPLMNLDLFLENDSGEVQEIKKQICIEVRISLTNYIEKLKLDNKDGQSFYYYDEENKEWKSIEAERTTQNSGSKKLEVFSFIITEWPLNDRMIGRG